MRQRGSGRRLNAKGKLFFCGIFFLLGLLVFRVWFAPILQASAENEAKRFATKVISEAVGEVLHENNDALAGCLSQIDTSSGTVARMTTDAASANLLKEAILVRVNEALGEQTQQVRLPIGTLLGNEWLYGRGPEVPLQIVLAGNVSAEFESDFLSAGINQTQYRLSITVKAGIHTFLPGSRGEMEVETNVLVAEAILVGEVPKVYANAGFAAGEPQTTP